jgi:hypothetical protein
MADESGEKGRSFFRLLPMLPYWAAVVRFFFARFVGGAIG